MNGKSFPKSNQLNNLQFTDDLNRFPGRDFKKKLFSSTGVGIIVTIILIITTLSYIVLNQKLKLDDSKFSQETSLITPVPTSPELIMATPTPLPVIDFIKPTAIPTQKPKATATPTNTPTPQPTNTPTPTPRIPNPPQMSISYPAEGQVIQFTSPNQQFCVVDIPSGGDQSDLHKRHNSNNQGWTSYAPVYLLCYEPSQGANTLQLQYRNKYGEESPIYTRNFTFQRAQ